MGGELVLVLTDVSGHLTWPCPPAAPSPASPTPHPTAAIFLFEASNAATAVEKANLGCKQEAE